jgi:glycerol-3-phosphate acyltransferase PlsX
MTDELVTIAVDAMGGDHAPSVVTSGVLAALESDPQLRVLLVGPAAVVEPLRSARCQPVVATEVIGMDEHPASAVRSKRDSSIVIGCRQVKDGAAQGFFSAGSTGACMAAATLLMGRIKGIARPAIATIIPGTTRPVVLLDVGANADVKPEMLVQFGAMGTAYARTILGVDDPSVALLNIGEEPTKGSMLAQEAHGLMAAQLPGFVGNVEGRDIPAGAADVIVTDGFTGNVVLKVMEGLAAALFGELKTALTSTMPNKLAAAVVQPSLRGLKHRLDPEAYGGAPLLGVDGVCIIGHGGSRETAIANGIAVAARAARRGLTARIAAAGSSAPSGDSD